jgi:hypothetical protein
MAAELRGRSVLKAWSRLRLFVSKRRTNLPREERCSRGRWAWACCVAAMHRGARAN